MSGGAGSRRRRRRSEEISSSEADEGDVESDMSDGEEGVKGEDEEGREGEEEQQEASISGGGGNNDRWVVKVPGSDAACLVMVLPIDRLIDNKQWGGGRLPLLNDGTSSCSKYAVEGGSPTHLCTEGRALKGWRGYGMLPDVPA